MSEHTDTPGDNDWLSENEKKFLDNLNFLKRRSEWRLGRWTTKNAVKKFFSDIKELSFSDIEILSKDNGAPQTFIKKDEIAVHLSISHRMGKAVCVLTDTAGPIGCDLEWIEPRSIHFINDYFTTSEINYIEQHPKQRNLLANLIWSAKESTLKLLQLGLNLDTRHITINNIEYNEDSDWKNLSITVKENKNIYGTWKEMNGYIFTIACLSKPDDIIKLSHNLG